MKKRDLVIILVNYHSSDDTRACLKSIEQACSLNPFIVIVDNSQPNDQSLRDLEGDSLKLIQTDKNVGFGRANNLAINWALEHIESDWVLLLNNDTLLEDKAIEKMITCFEKDSEIGIVTCKTVFANAPELIWYGGGEINYEMGWPKITQYNQKATDEGANKSRFVTFASGCVMLFKRSCLEHLKGFDDAFFMYVEDLEISLRAIKEGYKIWYTSDAVVRHKVQGSFTNGNDYKGMHPRNNNVAFHFYHKKLNQWITFGKHLRGKEWNIFRRNYRKSFIKTLLKLILKSPKRFEVIKSARKVLRDRPKFNHG